MDGLDSDGGIRNAGVEESGFSWKRRWALPTHLSAQARPLACAELVEAAFRESVPRNATASSDSARQTVSLGSL